LLHPLKRLGSTFARGERTATALQITLLALPALWLLGYLFPPINHDVGANLDMAQRWLQGETLYRDIIDVNTPLVFVIYAIPAGLGLLTPIDATVWLTVCFTLAIAASFALVRRSLRQVEVARQSLTAALLPAMTLYLMAVFPGEHFGQREHLMMICGLPYAMLAAARADRTATPRLVLLVALFAAPALALKPHFAAVPLLVELYVLWQVGWRAYLRDATPWTIAVVYVGHIALAVFGTPHYFITTMPLILGSYTRIGDTDVWHLLGGRAVLPTVVVLGILTVAAFRMFGSLSRTIALFGLGGLVASLAQAKGWPYHVMPAMAATFLLGTSMVTKIFDRYLSLDPWQHRVPVAVATSALMLVMYYEAALLEPPFAKQREFEGSITGRLLNIVERETPNKTVLILSPGIYPHYPLINYAHVRNTMRFQTMWVLQGIYADCPEMGPLYNPPRDPKLEKEEAERDPAAVAESFVFRTVAMDFARELPDLLIADRVAGIPRCRGDEFQYLDYFSRNPLFAKTLERYEFFTAIERYEILRRVR